MSHFESVRMRNAHESARDSIIATWLRVRREVSAIGLPEQRVALDTKPAAHIYSKPNVSSPNAEVADFRIHAFR